MADFYLWIKALHIISVTFKVMERRLLKAIVNPAIVLVWLTGPWLAYQSGYYQSPWLWAKFVLVLMLSAIHGVFARTVKIFAADKNVRSPRFYRILNEIPTLLLVAIVVLVVVKPF
jgi:protoporphyrinogen IX oxidase